MSDPPPQRHTQAAIFRRAVLTCLLNPNAYAFMLAAFPAFMQPAGEPLTTRALQLGSIIAATQPPVLQANPKAR